MKLHNRMSHKANQSRSAQVLALLAIVFLLPIFPLFASADPWPEHSARLPAFAKKLEDLEKETKELLEQKKAAEEPAALRDIIKQLSEKEKAMAEAAKAYEAERLHIRFKHPDRADVIERQYVHYKLKSLDELENEIGIDGRLDRLKAKVLATFPLPPKVPDAAKLADKRGPASVENEDAPEIIHLKK